MSARTPGERDRLLAVIRNPQIMVVGDTVATMRAEDGRSMAELQAISRSVEALMSLPAEPPPAPAPRVWKGYLKIDSFIECMGLALAETETRAERRVEQLRDELLARIAELERRSSP